LEVASPTRPVLRYFGGKWLLAPWIISHFPAHRVYVEPFGGGGSVLMRKKMSYAEVYNDLDEEVVNVFRVMRQPWAARKLRILLERTPFARAEFDLSYLPTTDPVERARRTVIRSIQGFGANACNSRVRTGFRFDSFRSGTTPSHDWVSYSEQLAGFLERLRGVTIEQRDAFDLMPDLDSEETLFFVDPPYVHATRNTKNGYRYEMPDSKHEELCGLLQTLKGMVILCGYENPIYDSLGWSHVKREAHADGARDRTEVLWLNPAAVAGQSQMTLKL
jgi:DNA adenine methylase